MRNRITDVPGLKVGHAEDRRLGSGATAMVFDAPAIGSIDVRGGGPGTRETALLDPAQTVEGIDAIALAGGSAFGLDAASGVQAWLKEQRRSFAVRTARVPIVSAAIVFDLLSGGDKDWGRFPPYRELGYAAAAAAGLDFALGSVGTGATTWSGHVAIVRDRSSLLHANAFHMSVVIEPIAEAVSRIRDSGSEISSVRRIETPIN